jgi:hypothetical protein
MFSLALYHVNAEFTTSIAWSRESEDEKNGTRFFGEGCEFCVAL